MDATSFILPLGWGTGYDAKTITDLLGEETYRLVVTAYQNTSGLGKPGRNKNAQWLGALDSPKSRKVVVHPDNTLEPLGWVEAKIVAVDQSDTDWLTTERTRFANKKPSFAKITVQDETTDLSNTDQAIQKVQKKSDSSQNQATKVPLIRSFSNLPKIGDRFEGVVFDVNSNEILLEIPGLDPDQTAYAVIARSGVPTWLRTAPANRLTCRVTAIEKESESYWRIQCELD